MTDGKPFQCKNMRLLPIEDSIITQACAALCGVERTQLMQEAILLEAARLGIRYSMQQPPPLTTSWPYMPERGEEPTAHRIAITMSIAVSELLSRAADYVHTSEPQFIIGATMAHIGRLQKCFRGNTTDTPEEATKIRTELAKIKLPTKYQYGRRGKRDL